MKVLWFHRPAAYFVVLLVLWRREHNRKRARQYSRLYYSKTCCFFPRPPRRKLTDEERRIRKRASDKSHRKRSGRMPREQYIAITRIPEPIKKLRDRLRNRVRRILKRRSIKSPKSALVGCSGKYLKEYLESRFTRHMSWENMGTFWCVDHIVPISKFDLSDPIQFKLANHYTNLQPLENSSNIIKSDKIEKPIQPELPLHLK